MISTIVPVLEIGGSHVTSARVRIEGERGRVLSQHRASITPSASADELVSCFVGAAEKLEIDVPSAWAVAIPGPFDYEKGVGRFRDVAKFESLDGFDLAGALRNRLGPIAANITFTNDAAAFALGECIYGAGLPYKRVIGLTLGTGVGSAFISDRVVVTTGEGVPAGGWIYSLPYRKGIIDDVVSTRGIKRAFHQATGKDKSVLEIAIAANDGDANATLVFAEAARALADVLKPIVERFAADAVIVGGSIAKSWTLTGGLLSSFIAPLGVVVVPSRLGDAAALIGAATKADLYSPTRSLKLAADDVSKAPASSVAGVTAIIR